MLYGTEHVERYLQTDGDEGYRWLRDTTILILFTTGRSSGKQRRNALIYRDDADRHIVVASKGGADQHPDWYLNLKADPHAQIQVKGDRIDVRARDAAGEERERLWKKMAEAWPQYDDYQQKTEREIPIVVLETTG